MDEKRMDRQDREFIVNIEKNGINKVILSARPTVIRLSKAHADYCILQLAKRYSDQISVIYGGATGLISDALFFQF